MDVSVIIPFYKGHKYLSNLERMLEANYRNINEYSMEVLFVNDYPEDILVLDTSIYKYEVHVINNITNVGIHRSRLIGLENSKGEFILFLDQDDEIDDTLIVNQLQKIKKSGADIMITNGLYMNPDGSKHLIYKNNKHLNCCKDINCYICFTNPIVSPGQALIRRDAIPDEWKGHFFSENGADDFYLWLLMFYYKREYEINPQVLYTHVYTGENTSFQSEKMKKSINEMIENLEGKYSRYQLWKIKRRNIYSASYKKGILHKLLYLDVCLSRKIYCVLHF